MGSWLVDLPIMLIHVSVTLGNIYIYVHLVKFHHLPIFQLLIFMYILPSFIISSIVFQLQIQECDVWNIPDVWPRGVWCQCQIHGCQDGLYSTCLPGKLSMNTSDKRIFRDPLIRSMLFATHTDFVCIFRQKKISYKKVLTSLQQDFCRNSPLLTK